MWLPTKGDHAELPLQEETMIVRVRLFANLVQYRPGAQVGQPFGVELVPGNTLADLVAHLQLPREQVKVIFVNAVAGDLHTVLQSGDEIGIFSPIGGGSHAHHH